MAFGWNRRLSLAAYVAGAVLIGRARDAQATFLFLITQAPVLVFIWFADYWSEWLGPFPMPQGGRGRVIDQESPAWLIATFGWMILLMVFYALYADP